MSIYRCKNCSEVSALVRDQPTPDIFFKVFLELDMKNLLSYLAFDRESIEKLLSEKNKKYFNKDYPLFFKNTDTKSAIDVALARN